MKHNLVGNGKGSGKRSCKIPEEHYRLKWEVAFGSNENKEYARLRLVELGYTEYDTKNKEGN